MVNIVVILIAVASTTFAKPAVDQHGCRPKEDAFLSCLMDSGNHIFKMLPKGDKKIGLPVLDPLEVKRMDVLNNGANMHLEITDAVHTGLGNTVIHEAQADPEHFKFKLNVSVPLYTIKGTYDMNAKIAAIPLKGNGPADITLSNVSMIWVVEGHSIVKKGKQYMDLTDFKVDLAPKAMTVHLSNLFDGNKELGSTINTFLNQNWRDVFTQLKPSMEKSFAELMKTIGSTLLEKVPYDNMFPDM